MAEHEASPGIPSAPLSWRVRVCRWLWHVLGFIWGTLIVGIVIATIANLNTTTTDTPLAKLYIVRLAQTYPLPVWLGLGLLAALTLLSWLGSRGKRVTPAASHSEQDRINMLRRLHVRYEQILAQSLQGAVQLELGLASRPDAVHNAVGLALRLPVQPEQSLPPHTSIVQAYELAQQDLLILGEPGAGKSTLLVELASFLVKQAEQDATRPLPILLPLASWAERQHPLSEWLSEEITRLYDVPRRLSQRWVAAEQVLPLLDGLDEMEHAARPACVAAINAYHREHLHPLVVCSRTSEYDVAAGHEPLALHTAVVVQPLSIQQVDTYLVSLGKPLAVLHRTLKKHAALQELATTPLMLQVLMLTYHGTRVRELSHKEAQLRRQIWADYVERMVERKGNAKRYPLQVTTSWLSWLAQQMRAHNQTVFLLEQMQPDWLPEKRITWYRMSISMSITLIIISIGMSNSKVGLLGLFGGIFCGAFFGRVTMAPRTVLSRSWKASLGGLLGGLSIGLLLGLIIVLSGLSSNFPIFGQNNPLLSLLSGGSLIGLLVGLLTDFTDKQLPKRVMLSPNEGITRSTKNGIFAGLLTGLLTGLLDWLTSLSSSPLLLGLFVGLFLGLFFGLGASLQHYTLRYWLARLHLFPWKAVPFLEDATARILLRRVGGGYSFTHQLLLDYFADLDVQTPLAPGAAQTNSTSVQTKASTSADES